MPDALHTVLITGVGLVSSLGEGVEAHVSRLRDRATPQPRIEADRFAPYLVHPLPEIDWSRQIAKKGDQRQMETWQKIGVYTAGLALDDAAIPVDESVRSGIDMIVAAGGGERDPSVDALVMARARGVDDPRPLINELLSSELRPTLFLAQLSNLMAGNISIVHKVTGSSRTFMGEEGAGVSAVQVAAARVRAGQSRICLVGGAFSAERKDLLLNYELAGLLPRNGWQPVSERRGDAGGIVPGSMGAFLVLESADSARERGATAYGVVRFVAGDRGRPDAMSERLGAMVEASGVDGDDALVLSGATGLADDMLRETQALFPRLGSAPVRAVANLVGHGFEAQFPASIALGAICLAHGILPAPAGGGEERPASFAPRSVVVTSHGHRRGEGVCVLESTAA
ncbi:beta-ketoacyl-ACP synthase [Aureimonas jatrophae]|uniref:3-oxoacyl-[acyl-carrier-protein] synthase II n=1 Tax=Aureimonas jatrophae TaxID=1166073 RepID=A0A1H0GDQ3_9HYPH|nr:beta-ketoacyl-ACP synthase [Aureimonas jatrophae]MBB3949519.1 3-oxoacyl-[acyl-carrier-protein] synthase II [Aureimonas jatrophae]SDO04889.1 3-oxoacyl-[acyl-carrier-protein] synthase II [Aureimonas jatrophae]